MKKSFLLLLLVGCMGSSESLWEPYDFNCEKEVSTKEEFAECLMTFNVLGAGNRNKELIVSQIEETQIKINKGIISNFFSKPKEAFIYEGIAADLDGKLFREID